jgi:DNA-binding LacI/PurR family transcriptional regulator
VAQPTMEDVARAAGVSRALVSLVMRDAPNVSDRRRAAVLEAADRLGYRPNMLARNLASRRTSTLGVMINDLHNPFFAEVVDGIQRAADTAGHQLLFTTGGAGRSAEAAGIETLLRFRVDGLILAGISLPTSQIEEAATSMPTVLVGRQIRSRRLDTVNNDELLGAQLAVSHLVELGHERIAHIDGGTGAGGADRRAGYERAVRDLGLERSIRVVVGEFTDAAGVAGAAALLGADDPPSAIFAANDLVAVGVLAVADELGLSVPGDLSIVGYDNTAIAAMRHLSITTIDQPRAEMGATAVQLLLERLDTQRATAVHHVATPTLVARATTGRPR